ncbi:MAG: YbhB/YbcL family Raf kinase inhibitor-like protein [Sedimentisphaerales bacterium]|nr:YbhB/YbcL family Raf kinase inhibitor-like protein [Sedimentisphaerales bacterium]
MGMKISSSAFTEGGPIPSKHTCDGQDVSPPLKWDSVPDGTKSIALICDDPDAPMGTFVHWVLYNLPADTTGLPENMSRESALSTGAAQGTNDFGRLGYGGPCPPGGTHRYYFKVYALDAQIDPGRPGLKKNDVLKAMKGHILAEGQLMGKYTRK